MASNDVSLAVIIGTGRCGSTMLRELMSQHSRIAFPIAELQELPYLIEKLGADADFSDRDTVGRLLKFVRGQSYGFHLRQSGIELNDDDFVRLLRGDDWVAAVKALVRLSLDEPKRSDPDVLIGDKSPHNIIHLESLARILPGSRFVHLVRDPRDVCRSMHNAWGTSYYRAAVRWRQQMEQFDEEVERAGLEDRCLTIKYEQLLTEPRQVMTEVCSFLGLTFEEQMLSLRFGAERMGDAASSVEIVRSNYGKYRESLSVRTIEQIEAITWHPLQRYGYEPEQASGPVGVNWARNTLLLAIDQVRSIRSQISQKGLVAGVRYRLSQIHTKRAAMRSGRWRRGL